MLKEFSVRYVILGIPSAGTFQLEVDELISKKVPAALSRASNRSCRVGETLTERESGRDAECIGNPGAADVSPG